MFALGFLALCTASANGRRGVGLRILQAATLCLLLSFLHYVVVFGATSFVDQILTRYLFDEFGLDGKLRWAAAGRSLPKLEEVRKSLGRGGGKLVLWHGWADPALTPLRQLRAGLRAATVNSTNLEEWDPIFEALDHDELDVLFNTDAGRRYLVERKHGAAGHLTPPRGAAMPP